LPLERKVLELTADAEIHGEIPTLSLW
jgi:hypothetical protein